MFTGTKTGNSTGSYLKTGLSSFQLLGVNPSKTQIEEWTGRDNVKEPNYDLTDDLNQNRVRPLNIYLKNTDGVVINFRLNVGSVPAITKSGNYQVCTSTGSIVWAKASGQTDPKPEFSNHKPLNIGEADWITFVARLINFDFKSGEDFYGQLTTQGLDVESLYNASYKGVNNLASWAVEHDKRIVMVMTVREKDVPGEDGSIKTKQYQSVSSASELWFHGDVTEWAETTVQKRYEKSLEVGVGQVKAYPLITDLFTYKYQDFVREQCVNAVPANPAPSTNTSGWN